MASKKGVKKKDHEKLDDANIQRVRELLAAEKPITKKDACEILNISYNTTRLNNIIEEYVNRKERRKKNFARMKGVPLSDREISTIVMYFLQGDPISDISEYTFRSPAVVKRVIEDVGVPERAKGDALQKPAFLPDECILTREPIPEEILWSATYHAACVFVKVDDCKNRDGTSSYLCYVYEPTKESSRRGGFYASHRIEELGSLEHLQKYINPTQLVA